MIPPARSITHQHLLSVVNTEWRRRADAPAGMRLLDAGCGDGSLIAYLACGLPQLAPGLQPEIYGFDLHDHGVQPEGFLEEAIAALDARLPDLPWAERIRSIAAGQDWPYPDDFFDAILSNQVLEHVADHDHFFAETRRVLKPGGYAAHLFPLRHYIYEGHLHLPFVHRIGDFDLLRSYIAWMSRFGLGKYRAHRRASGVSLADYVERHADYMHHFTNYLTHGQVLQLGKRHGLRTTFRYTREFYTGKLRALARLSPRYCYALRRSALCDRISLFFCRYISGITLLLTREQTY